MNGHSGESVSNPPAEARWYVAACFALMLAAMQVALGPWIQLSQWQLSSRDNAAVAEGVAWLHGRLDLGYSGDDPVAGRLHDTALYNGRVYNVFPPLLGILTVVVSPLHRLLERPEGLWLQTLVVLLFFWPLPIVGFVVFRRQIGDSAWAALLTIAWMGGTALLPCLHDARGGDLGRLNHAISQIGLLIFAADLLGRQRLWPALCGLLISTYTRQLTFLYALPLLWVAGQRGRRPLMACLAGLALIAAPLLLLNWLKFDNPLEFGYRYIYVGREQDYMGARCLEYGLFHPHFIAENAWYLNLAPPRIDIDGIFVRFSEANNNGTGMWITSPLLIWVVLAARQWWADPRRRLLMLATVPLIAGLLCYHSPGYLQQGFNRFALDFLPIWLAVIAPWARAQGVSGPGRWRTWLTLCCVAWSLLYFQSIAAGLPSVRTTRSPVASAALSSGASSGGLSLGCDARV